MLKNNYHTHMKYCNHAEGMVIDYVSKANELGFKELGMSDHAPIPFESMDPKEFPLWDADTMRMHQIDDYLKQIEEAKKLYPNLTIYSGFETEYLDYNIAYYKSLRAKVDYLNLGMHYYEYDGRIVNTYTEVNYSNIEGYLMEAEKALSLGIFTCFVHPDLFFYGYKDLNGEHIFDEYCEKAARAIAKLAMKYDVYLEVNCNGLKYCKDKYNREVWLYPYPRFWEIIKEYPVKIVLGADAHTPDALCNENVELVCKFVEELRLPIQEKMVLK